ncbi:MAG TPA: hypothetical protein VK679_01345 [Gemmatimonadaceae bacterium]|jgi:hypothetical protein|nr:hypothetical protein [Gemmatimonadaceae bacterium]
MIRRTVSYSWLVLLAITAAGKIAAQPDPACEFKGTVKDRLRDGAEHDVMPGPDLTTFTQYFPTAIADTKDLCINAITGAVSGVNQYSMTQRVRVVVYNVNPFRFRYRIDVAEVGFNDGAAIADFWKLVTGIALPQVSAPPEKLESTKPLAGEVAAAVKAAGGGAVVCGPDATSVIDEVNVAVGLLGDQWKQIDGMVGEAKHTIQVADNQYASDTLVWSHDDVSAVDIYRAGVDAEDPLGRVAKLDVKSIANATSTYRDVLQAAADRLDQVSKPAPVGCIKLVADLTVKLSELRRHLTQLTDTTIPTLTSTVKSHDQAAKDLATTINNPGHFYTIRLLPQHDGGTKTTITLRRRMGDKDTTTVAITNQTIRYGRPLFTVGIGLAWADLPSRSFKAIKHFAPQSNGTGDTVVSVVGIDNDAGSRISPMATIDLRAWPIDTPHRTITGIDAVLGGTVSQQHTVAPEFFVGGAVSGVGDWLRIGFGWYIGQVVVLPPGLAVGSVLPSDVVPVRTRLAAREALLVAFKLH